MGHSCVLQCTKCRISIQRGSNDIICNLQYCRCQYFDDCFSVSTANAFPPFFGFVIHGYRVFNPKITVVAFFFIWPCNLRLLFGFCFCFEWVDVNFFSRLLIKAICLCLKFELMLLCLCFCFFVFHQFNYISASRSRCKILFGFCTNAIIDNDDRCAGICAEGVACVAWPRRPVGSSGACSRHHGIIFTERYRFGARRFTRFVSGKRRAQSMCANEVLLCCDFYQIILVICNE